MYFLAIGSAKLFLQAFNSCTVCIYKNMYNIYTVCMYIHVPAVGLSVYSPGTDELHEQHGPFQGGGVTGTDGGQHRSH